MKTAVALACAAAACPATAGAEDQPPGNQPVLSSLVEGVLAVPAATLPSVSVTLGPAPSQPGESARPADTGDAAPQAYIKDRVVVKTFHGTVMSVDPSSGQIVVRTKRRTASGRVIKRRQAFGLTGAKLHVADTNGDGTSSMADIVRGDQVRLRAAIGRGPLRTAVPLAARELVDKGQPVHVKRRGRRLR